jgi:hypothetical protein
MINTTFKLGIRPLCKFGGEMEILHTGQLYRTKYTTQRDGTCSHPKESERQKVYDHQQGSALGLLISPTLVTGQCAEATYDAHMLTRMSANLQIQHSLQLCELHSTRGS